MLMPILFARTGQWLLMERMKESKKFRYYDVLRKISDSDFDIVKRLLQINNSFRFEVKGEKRGIFERFVNSFAVFEARLEQYIDGH